MTKFYIVRHGETDYNKNSTLQGRIDIPLNETGKAQAKQIAEELKDVEFDVVYCSPLTRAKQTAEEILKNRGVEYIEAPEIIERNFGELEGTVCSDYELPFYGLWNYNLEPTVLKGGESMDDMKKRIFPFLDKLRKERIGQTICLVCHGGVTLIIREYFEGVPESGSLLDYPQVQNGKVIIFEG